MARVRFASYAEAKLTSRPSALSHARRGPQREVRHAPKVAAAVSPGYRITMPLIAGHRVPTDATGQSQSDRQQPVESLTKARPLGPAMSQDPPAIHRPR
jgi:hypothetical protein